MPDEETSAFKIDTSAKIPDLSIIRSPEHKAERLESLMSVPGHKPVVPKFNPEQMVRTMIPLTQEDKGQSGNLPLINTLRQPLHSQSVDKSSGNPPSFYDEDQKKWSNKFAQSIKERQEFKRKFLANRKTTVLNSNDNLTLEGKDWDAKLKSTNYTGGQLLPAKSEFKQVLMRRKSR